MSVKIEFHALHPFPFSCLNRDQNNSPKSMRFGGVTRDRDSAQCEKYWLKHELNKKFGTKACRTKLKDLTTRRYGEEEAKKILNNMDLTGVSDDVHMFITAVGAENWFKLCEQAKEKKVENADVIQQVFNEGRNSFIMSLFGRFVASKPDLQIKAAMQTAHGFSVNKSSRVVDFFTGVDDLNAMNAHIGEAEYTCPIFYRYSCLDCSQLLENMNGDKAAFQEGLEVWLRTLPQIVPQGKITTTAHYTDPEFVMYATGEHQNLSLANAFLEPVTGSQLMQQSINRMKVHFNRLNDGFPRDLRGCFWNIHDINEFSPNITFASNINVMSETVVANVMEKLV